jgi:hypothetical protein
MRPMCYSYRKQDYKEQSVISAILPRSLCILKLGVMRTFRCSRAPSFRVRVTEGIGEGLSVFIVGEGQREAERDFEDSRGKP